MNFKKLLLAPITVDQLVNNVEEGGLPLEIKACAESVQRVLNGKKNVNCYNDQFKGASPEISYLYDVANLYRTIFRRFRLQTEKNLYDEVEENLCLSEETMNLLVEDINLFLNDKENECHFIHSVNYPALFFQMLLVVNIEVSKKLEEMSLS